MFDRFCYFIFEELLRIYRLHIIDEEVKIDNQSLFKKIINTFHYFIRR